MRMSNKIEEISKNQHVKVISLLNTRCLFKIKKKQSNKVIKQVSMKDWGKLRKLRKSSKITINKNPVLHLTKIWKSLMWLMSPETSIPQLEITTVDLCITKGLLKMIFFSLKLMVTSGLLQGAIKVLRKILFKRMGSPVLY